MAREEADRLAHDLEGRSRRTHEEHERATSELTATYDGLLREREAEYSRRLSEVFAAQP